MAYPDGLTKELLKLRAIDPGNRTGVAFFNQGVLVQAYVIPWTKFSGGVADEYHTVVEVPDRVERGIKPMSIVSLALKAGELIGRFRASPVKAGEWKASVRKDVMCHRVMTFLEAPERAILPKIQSALGYDHNMLDAVGLGLFVLGRMPKGGRKW